jgi:hypothetical protein
MRRLSRRKQAGSEVSKHRDGAARAARDSQITIAVGIQISGYCMIWSSADRVTGRCVEIAVIVADQDRDVRTARVGSYNIQLSIIVYVNE